MIDKKHYDTGIVGWWFSSNYGSALTYYGLGKMLEDLGYSSIMLQLSKVNRTPWEPQVKKSIDFMSKHFPISEKIDIDRNPEFNQLCDTFILGSDQLWNKLGVDLLGYTFFLDFADDSKKKMAYATSFGNSQFEGTPEQKEYIHYLLSKFDYISVREASGIKASKEAFNINVERDLDPVFVCDRKHYDRLADSCGELEKDNNYLFTYILDVNDEKQKAIDYAAQKLGLRVVSALDMRIPADKKAAWHTGELKEDLSIEEFVYYIKNCKYMITDSHHGACFAMIYNKEMLTISNSGRGLTRFTHLFNLFELNHRLVHNVEDIYTNDSFFQPTDYKTFNKLLEKEKKVSLKRFMNALKKPKSTKKFELFKKPPVPTPQSVMDTMNKDPDFVKIRVLATLLRDYGIKHVVLSPGGRDVPIVRMFENNEGTFTIHRVTDERSAAYYGLGIAAQLQEPVACVCTSGTAASNYLPAVTEAYFTGVPLIMITADRRDVYHGQGEDQTIPQKHIYDGVVKKSISLPEGTGYHADYQTRRDIQDCILESTHNGFGPVHINVTIDNIAVGASAPKSCWSLLPKINPHILRVGPCDGEAQMMKWVDALKHSKRILVVYGQNARPTKKQLENIEKFASKYNCVIVNDHIANLNSEYSLKPFNMLTAISNAEFNDNLAPDILITVGGKSLMNDPLTFKVRGGPGSIRHWSVTPDGKVKDFFFRLSSVLEMSQDYFFEWFADHAGKCSNNREYLNRWKMFNDRYKTPVDTTFNSLYIQSKFLPAVPDNSLLHLAVGQTFFFCRRYDIKPSVQVFCNMGTNGIDGCTSTFMGQCAVAKDRLCFLLVGDLSFFYDMNGIWNKELNKNIRILLVNNGGSGLLGGHGLKAIRAAHSTEAKGWVESVGFEYISARDEKEYEEKLNYFLSDKPQKALFFEVFCK